MAGSPGYPIDVTGSASRYYVQRIANVIRSRKGYRLPDTSKAQESDPQIWLKALRDSKCRMAITKRLHAVAGREVSVTARSRRIVDQSVAEIQQQALEECANFLEARALLASAIFRGSAACYIEGERRFLSLGSMKDARGQILVDPVSGEPAMNPPLWWWVPTRLVDVDPYRLEKGSFDPRDMRPVEERKEEWGLWSLTRDTWERFEHPEFWLRHLHEPSEKSLGYGNGIQEALIWDLNEKAELRISLRRGVRRAAEGSYRVAIDSQQSGMTEAEANDVVSDWTEALEIAHEDGDLIHEKNADVELLQVPYEGLRVCLDRIKAIDEDMTSLILFGTRSTGTASGDTGARAQAETEKDSGEEEFAFDQDKLAPTLQPILELFHTLNRANMLDLKLGEGRCGKLKIGGKHKVSVADELDAVDKLTTAGAELVLAEVYSRCGEWSLPKKGEPVLRRSPAPTPFGAPPPAPPGDEDGVPEPEEEEDQIAGLA